MKQAVLADSRDGPVRPVIRTFYDHSQVTPVDSILEVCLLVTLLTVKARFKSWCVVNISRWPDQYSTHMDWYIPYQNSPLLIFRAANIDPIY